MAEGVLDHVAIQCADVAASATFYDTVPAPLGGGRILDFAAVATGAEVLHEAVCHAPG